MFNCLDTFKKAVKIRLGYTQVAFGLSRFR